MKKRSLLIVAVLFISFSMNAQNKIISSYKGGKYIGSESSKDFAVIYEQLNAPDTGYASQDFEADLDAFDCRLADDFTVPAGQTWNIDSISWIGSWNGNFPLAYINIWFYTDNGGIPDSVITAFPYQACTTDTLSGTSQVMLDSTISLTEGTYWLSLQAFQNFETAGQWFWSVNAPTTGAECLFINPENGFGFGAFTWTPGSEVWGAGPDYDLAFGLYENTTVVAVEAMPEIMINIYPNPSDERININVDDKFELEIFDITGKCIKSKIVEGNSSLNISTKGIYFFRFRNDKASITKKVIVQ